MGVSQKLFATAGLKDKRLVLIDTAGMNQNDVRMTEQLSMLRQSHDSIKLISVLIITASTTKLRSPAQYGWETFFQHSAFQGQIIYRYLK